MVSAGRSKIRWLSSILKLLCISCSVYLSIESDTISLGQSISPNQTLISKGGTFELGFFSPGNSSNRYIGIWYKTTPVRTVVWVANRAVPIPNTSGYSSSSLLLSEDGHLVLYSGLRTAIWSTNSTIEKSTATKAILLDSGNLVLRNELGGVVWQSFDFPTDTWLPDAAIGLDKATESRQVLVSWRNSEDPAPGLYSMGIDPSGSAELFIWRNVSQISWRSGIRDWRSFPFVSENRRLPRFTYVPTPNYFTYNNTDKSIMLRIVIGTSGQLNQFLLRNKTQEWVIFRSEPSNQCQVYGLCGAFGVCNIESSPMCRCLRGYEPKSPTDWNLQDFSSGCVRKKPLTCKRDREVFVQIPNIRLPAYSEPFAGGRDDICEYICSTNCSCSAYSYSSSGGCSLWSGDLLDLEEVSNNTSGGVLYLKQASDTTTDRGKTKLQPLPIAVPTILALIICGSIFHQIRRRKLNRKGKKETNQNLLLLKLDISSKPSTNSIIGPSKIGEAEDKVIDLPLFSFSSISAATDNFSTANKLGQGGFGPVYKGNLLNGQSVAVKRLSKMSGQGLEELRNETILIAKLQHRNLVRLLGCCIEQDEKILIYEYMPNKSLDSFLFNPKKRELLNWIQRVHIIEGISQGILYLHQYSRLRIVHRDLKASNILLDVDMNPKISDFGMARIFGGTELQANTNRIVGTYGYMSPEYAMEGLFSIKSDVFAFGVLLLEIVSGKRNTGFQHSNYLSLLGYAWELWGKGRLLELIDPVLQVPSSSCMPARYIQVGLLCVQECPVDRPTISDVVTMLSNENTTIDSPNRPAFITGVYTRSGRGKTEHCSINNCTASVMEGR